MLLDYSKHIAARTEGFTGREWVFELIERWLAKPDRPRFFILTGMPGDGKTAIAARLCRYSLGTAEPPDGLARLGRDFISAFHFCRAREFRSINPIVFVSSLATQLANRFPEYVEVLRGQREARGPGDRPAPINVTQTVRQLSGGRVVGVEVNVRTPSPQDAFVLGLREPLEALHVAGKLPHVLILVDALDESLLYDGRTNIVELLAHSEMLPPGVNFILTYRHVPRVLDAFGGPDAEVHSLADGAGRRRSQHDVERYVRGLLDEEPGLAAKLSEGFTTDSFVGAVADKSKGNFLYARYLLPMLTRGPAKITKNSLQVLPSGLNPLYAKFLRRQVGRGWRTRCAAVAGTLAITQEALTERQLSALTGKKQTSVRASLRTLSPFLRPADGRAEESRAYTIYHESFVDFLLDEHSAGEFWCDPAEQHRLITDRCLRLWGGLAKNLPGLADPARRLVADGYGLRHASHHFEGAGRAGELHALLATRNRERRSAWYEARLAEENVAGYVGDVQRAWRLAEADAQSSLDGRADLALGLQVRYALVVASLRNLSVNLPPALLAALYENKIWKLPTAAEYALHAPDPRQRALGLAALAPRVTTADAPQLLAAILEITDDNHRAVALAHAGPHLLRAEAEQVLEAVGQLGGTNRGYALVHIVPGLPSHLLPEAARLAEDLTDLGYEYSDEHVRSAVAERYAELGQHEEARRLARKLRGRHWHSMVWLKLVLSLPARRRATVTRALFRRALKLNDGVFAEQEMAVLVAIQGGLAEDERLEASRIALNLARDNQTSEWRLGGLLRLGPHVPAELLPDVRRDVEKEFVKWYSRDETAGETIRLMAVRLSDWEGPSAALRVVSKIDWLDSMMEAKSALLPLLSGAEHDETLSELRSAAAGSDVRLQMATRASLARHLPDGVRERALRRMLDEAWAIGDAAERAETLAALAPSYARLGDRESARRAMRAAEEIGESDARDLMYRRLAREFAESGFLDEAFDAVRMIRDKNWLLRLALENIIPYLTAPYMPAAVEEARKVTPGTFLSDGSDELFKRLGLHWLELGDLEQALATARERSSDRFSRLAEKLARLPASPSAEQLREVLDDSHYSIFSANDNPLTADAEAALALPDQGRAGAVREIARGLRHVEHLHHRIDVLKKILPHLPPRSRKRLLASTRAEILQQRHFHRVRNAAAFAQLLPEDEQAAAFREATEDARAEGLGQTSNLYFWDQTVPLLTPHTWEEAAALAAAVTNDYERDSYLSKLLPRLAELNQVGRALHIAVNLPRSDLRGPALASLVRYLDAEHLGLALDAARHIGDDNSRMRALEGLIPRLDESRLGDAMTVALGIKTSGRRSKLLALLAARMKAPSHRPLLAEALRALSRNARRELLEDLSALARAIEQLGGVRAIEETGGAVRDAGSFWP